MIQKRRGFLWAKAHLKWTVAKWKTILWSDESKFEVLFGKLGRHVIQTKEDKDNPSCKHGLVPTFLRCVDAMKFKINFKKNICFYSFFFFLSWY